MLTVELQVHAAAEQLPDADTDVLIFHNGFYQAELGAYIGHEEDGSPMWVDAHGCNTYGVTHWAELPWLPGAKQALKEAA